MTKQTSNKPQAIDAFTTKVRNIEAMLAELKEAADNHFDKDPDGVNWADVGSMEYLESRLKEISDCVFKRGEYAPENQ